MSKAEANRIFQEQDVEAVLELLADKQLLDKLLASGRLRYAIAADYQVYLSHRGAVDGVMKHTDKWGNPNDGWWDELEHTTEKALWQDGHPKLRNQP